MKKISLLVLFFLAAFTSFAQSEKFSKAMEAKVAQIDTARSPEGLTELANTFERIALAEKNQWLPYYYAGLANVLNGYYLSSGQGGDIKTTDMLADKAEQLVNKAEELSKDNSEIYVLRKMIATLRMVADPMNRYMQYGPVAARAIETAQKLNPENPRVYLLLGQDKFYTPEQFGGSKEEAKKLFQQSMEKYNAFKPENSISPTWGKSMLQYFMGQVN